MSFQKERQDIETNFFAGWDSKATPIKWDSVPGLTQGTKQVADQNTLTEFVHLMIEPVDALQKDMNAVKRVRFTGNIILNVFVKAGVSTQDRARQLADKAATILQNKALGSVNTRFASLANTGQAPNAQFYQMTVTVPYYRDDFF